MTVGDAISAAKQDFEKTINHLREEYSRLQAGRANASLVENLMVNVYGSDQPMKNIASISVPDSKSLMIQPWDKGNLGPIEKAIQISDLGLNPVNDGNVVRINIPPMTEERRTGLTKNVKKLAEEAKVAVRTSRQDAHNAFKKLKNDGEITEDDLHSADKKLQDSVDDANSKIDEVCKNKEDDIMTV